MKRISVFKNVSIFLAFGVMGLVTCLIGATYVHMERLFDVSSNTMSLSLTGIYSGGLLGAGLCATLYHKINPEVNMALTNAMAGLSTIAAFYSSHFVVFAFFMTLQGVAFGVLFAAAPLYLITMWKDTKWNRPVLNCLYTFWSVGALIGPFIIRLFICHKEHFNEHLPSNVTTCASNNSTLENHEKEFSAPCLKLAQSAFLVMGSIIFTTSIPFCVIYLVELFQALETKSKIEKTKFPNQLIHTEEVLNNSNKKNVLVGENNSKIKRSSNLIVSFFLFLFTSLTISIECITMQYVVNFAAKYLQWSVRTSSYLITIFFAAHALSRASNIVILLFCKPVVLLSINVVVCIAAFSSVVALIDIWPNVVYIAISIVGFVIASTYPSEILYVSENVHFTQTLSAISAVGTSMGGIISPFLLTSLISHFGLIFFAYYQIITAVLLFLTLIMQIVFFHHFFKPLPTNYV